MLRADTVIGAMNRALQLRPESLDGISMDNSANVHFGSMRNTSVIVSHSPKPPIGGHFIGINNSAGLYGFGHHRQQRSGFDIWDDGSLNAAFALSHTQNSGFAGGSTASLAGSFSAYIGLVNLYRAIKRVSTLLHEGTDLLLHTPSRLIGYSKVALNFLRGDAILGLAHKKNGVKPVREFGGRFVENRSGKGMYLVSAPGAGVALTALDSIEAGLLAGRATTIFPISLLKKIGQAGVIVWEVFVELCDSVFHYDSNLTRELLVVKG